MNRAIDKDRANRAAATASKRDAGKLIADIEPNAANGARIGAGQDSRRSWDLPRDKGAATDPLHVLIVEEEPEIGQLLAEILAEFGHVVYAVEVDGAAAAISARCGRVDLIIIDIGLGETTGIAFVEQILNEGLVPHVVVIADTLRGLAFAPEVALIEKPFHGSHLIAAITLAIEARSKANQPGSTRGDLETPRDGADNRTKRRATRVTEILGIPPGGASNQM